jgi:hypothetical protein
MGRPLAKRFFGNRNVGSSSTTADNGIGGEGVASVSQPGGGVGSIVISNTYQNFPTLTAAAPTIPGGVTALLSPVFEVATVTFSSGGQTNADYLPGLSTSIVGLGGGAIVNITEVASKVTAVDVTTAGTNRGEFRRGDITGAGITTFQVLQAPNAGTDLQINVTFRVKRIEVTEQGSGYVTVPALTWGGHTFTGQTAPSLNVVTLTTDTGAVSSPTNQENAIIVRAKTTGGGSVLIGDIQAQKGSHRYRIRTANGTAVCKLVATATPLVNQAYIQATDSTGNNYFVMKLSSRNAVVIRKAGGSNYEFANPTTYPNGQIVRWTFGAAVLNKSVQIENA